MKKKKEFWVGIEPSDENTADKIITAIDTCQKIHDWTVKELNRIFRKEARTPSFQELRSKLNVYITKEKLWPKAQRYSLERAAEQAFPHFSMMPKFDHERRLLTVPSGKVDSIQIKSRSLWKRYLAESGGITTAYGMIFLQGEWKETLREQADKIPLDLFPFLWHSATVRIDENKNFFLKFNFHSPKSKYGYVAVEKLEEEFGDIIHEEPDQIETYEVEIEEAEIEDEYAQS